MIESGTEIGRLTPTGPYADFLRAKERAHVPTGITEPKFSPMLFPFQQYATDKSLRVGRYCLFAGTGLGKTFMQAEFARNIPGKRLIVAPLGVTEQTIREAAKLGIAVKHAEPKLTDGIQIINYDRLDSISGDPDAIILDESSILKSFDGKTRKYIQDRFVATRYKLACTATPAPNDYMELGTHAEFVGAMTRAEMLATFFIHDGGDTSKWRLKRHAVADFWKWIDTWALVFEHPRDIGFDQEGYDLPPLHIHTHKVEVESESTMTLFAEGESISATSLPAVARESLTDRVAVTVDLARKADGPCLVWCNLNDEHDLLEKELPHFASVKGSDSRQHKSDTLLGFCDGKYPGLISKAAIAGYGLNAQVCHYMILCGVTYSFEDVFQMIRRCYRFGQTQPVHVHMVVANTQQAILNSQEVKAKAHSSMGEDIRRYARSEVA